MSQAGFTPIQLYFSTTAAATPSAGNLANGELAINITDGRLFYKDNGGVVRVLAGTGGTGVVAGSNTQVQFNNNGVFGASANMVFNGTRLTVADLADSGLTSGRVVYASTGGALVDSANLTFDGTTLTSAFSGPHNGTVGASTPNTGAFTTLTTSSTVTLNGGTANGVAYLNGSKVLTTGSALTFNGTSFGVPNIDLNNGGTQYFYSTGFGSYFALTNNANALTFGYNGSEQMRLTSTGLGIGTSSPVARLTVSGIAGNGNGLMSVDGSDFIRLFADATFGSAINWSAGDSLRFATSDSSFGSFTERMRIDSSGNLGLGVTPSAWSYGGRGIELTNNGFIAAAGQYSSYLVNTYYNGSNFVYKTSAQASYYSQQAGAHLWGIAPSGTAGNAISFTQAMTLDASGNLQVKPGNIFTDATSGIFFTGTIGNFANGIYGVGTNNVAISAGGSERARIDSSGNLLVGMTTAIGPGINSSSNFFVGGPGAQWKTTNFSAAYYFAYNNADRANINGSTGAYTALSDRNKKKDFQESNLGLAAALQLKPTMFRMLTDDDSAPLQLGFIAQDVENVVPQAYVEQEGPDGTFIGLQDRPIIAVLVKAIQEQQALIAEQSQLITALTARVAALESN